MSRFLVSIDPGKHVLGVALWERYTSNFLLRRAGLIEYSARPAQALIDWMGFLSRDWDLAIELPQVYRPSKSRARASDIVDLAAVVGSVEALCDGKITRYRPHAWKGGIEKPDRKGDPYPVEERCRLQLYAEELERVTLPRAWRQRMDVWDAVGIGLRHLKNGGLR